MHLPAFRTPSLRSRALITALALFALLTAAAASPVGAVEPVDSRDPGTLRRQAPPRVEPRPEPTVSPSAAPEPDVLGLDVSWPQCDTALPELSGFAVIGVNGGRVYTPNPCLGASERPSQLEWAGPEADLYINTGNPGPDVSTYWPHGQTAPRGCNTPAALGADTVDCAFTYGWNAAADSYRIALEAFKSLGWAEADAERIPGERTWWLDVETSNSWRLDWSLNVATLQGAVAYLESVEATEIGFYSTPLLWFMVTGGTDAFAAYPAWHAGASDLSDAKERCRAEEAFTGGELQLVQWVESAFDTNYRCPSE